MSSLVCLRCYTSCRRKQIVLQFKGWNNNNNKKGVKRESSPIWQVKRRVFVNTDCLARSSACRTSLCPRLGRVQHSAAVERGVRPPGRCRAVALGQANTGCPGGRDIVAENEIIGPGFQAVHALYFQLKSNIPALREYFSKLTI